MSTCNSSRKSAPGVLGLEKVEPQEHIWIVISKESHIIDFGQMLMKVSFMPVFVALHHPTSLFCVACSCLATGWTSETKSAHATVRKVWPRIGYSSGPAWYCAFSSAKSRPPNLYSKSATISNGDHVGIRRSWFLHSRTGWLKFTTLRKVESICGLTVDLLQGVAPLCWTRFELGKDRWICESWFVCGKFALSCIQMHLKTICDHILMFLYAFGLD